MKKRKSSRSDVTPPGREAQVRALKEKPGIENPYAVAWASYEGDSPTFSGATCDDCGQTVPVTDGMYVDHLSPGGSYGEETQSATNLDDPEDGDGDYDDSASMCDGSGKTCVLDHIEHRGGKWVLLAKSTGKVLGTHATKEEAEAQERAVQASKHGDNTRVDDPQDLVSAWRSWGGDWSPQWTGQICAICLKPIPLVANKIAPHMRDDAPPWKPEENHMCPGSGSEGGEIASRAGGCWIVVDPDVGKVLSEHPTREAADTSRREVLRATGQKVDGPPVTVRRYECLDFAPGELPKARVTDEGFLAVVGRVARTGIQEYRDGQGGTRRELRLPEEVSKSLPSFPLQPLTNNHPTEMVDPGNSDKYVKGAVGDAVLQADGWVVAPMRIYAADAIAAARGGRVQLSVGYTCRLDSMSGEWRGQKYDAVQRDIVVNHVALVDAARAGTDARLRLDAGDAVASLVRDTEEKALLTHGEQMAKLIINGMTFEVADANAQAAFDGFVAGITKASDEKVAAEKLRADTADKLRADAVKASEALQGKYDSKMAEDKQPIKLDGLEIAVGDAVDPVKFAGFVQPIVEARATARASLLVEARKHLGANEKFDAHAGKDGKMVASKSDDEIKRLVIGKLKPSIKLDGKGAEYVQALYDDAVANVKTVSPIDLARSTGSIAPQVELAGERTDNGKHGMDPEAAEARQDQAILEMNPRYKKRGA